MRKFLYLFCGLTPLFVFILGTLFSVSWLYLEFSPSWLNIIISHIIVLTYFILTGVFGIKDLVAFFQQNWRSFHEILNCLGQLFFGLIFLFWLSYGLSSYFLYFSEKVFDGKTENATILSSIDICYRGKTRTQLWEIQLHEREETIWECSHPWTRYFTQYPDKLPYHFHIIKQDNIFGKSTSFSDKDMKIFRSW